MAWTDAQIYSQGQINGVLYQQCWAEVLKRAQYEIAGATANVPWANKVMSSQASHTTSTQVAFKYALVDPATSAANGSPTDVQVQAIVGTYLAAIIAATP